MKRKNKKKNIETNRKKNKKIMIILIVTFGLLSIVATYAWFSTALNVRIKTFRMGVDRNSNLLISLDGINYDQFVEINEDTLITNLNNTYPNNISNWARNGLVPVSSNGITNRNTYFFNMFGTSGVLYSKNDRDNGFIYAERLIENERKRYSYYVAFDIFIKNQTGSPYPDNLYFDQGTEFLIPNDAEEELVGLANSIRLGIVKIGSTNLDAPVSTVQNLSCNNNCEPIIYEPNSRNHTNLSIERATKYGINLVNGERFPTYALNSAGGPIYVRNSVSGTSEIDPNYFSLQHTIYEEDFDTPLFEIPNGITKARVYLWIEGQDIDSLETNSKGTEMTISINFVKDTSGYTVTQG